MEYNYLEKCAQLMEAIQTHGNTDDEGIMLTALRANKDLIKEISDHVKDTGLYQDASEYTKEFKDRLEAKNPDADSRLLDAWWQFINRVMEAPTRIHLRGAVILLLPLCDHYLTEPTT